ncbi:MAG TPA: DNA N-6-adenine-methyltransferase [Gemmatimonadales bacterium]
MGANDKTGAGRGDWQTPPALFEALHRIFAFDTDLFASESNALCATWYSEDRSAFDADWCGQRCFGNPPYSRGFMDPAVEKAIEQRDRAANIVLLIPAATDAQWYRRLEKHATIWLLAKRVRFINPDTGLPGDSPPGGHGVALLRPSWMDR